jgi:hypothetical protein
MDYVEIIPKPEQCLSSKLRLRTPTNIRHRLHILTHANIYDFAPMEICKQN